MLDWEAFEIGYGNLIFVWILLFVWAPLQTTVGWYQWSWHYFWTKKPSSEMHFRQLTTRFAKSMIYFILCLWNRGRENISKHPFIHNWYSVKYSDRKLSWISRYSRGFFSWRTSCRAFHIISFRQKWSSNKLLIEVFCYMYYAKFLENSIKPWRSLFLVILHLVYLKDI